MLGTSAVRAAPTGKASGPRGAGPRKEDWIGDQLRRVYDEALREPVPPEMLALLDELDGATRAGQSKRKDEEPEQS
jgi:hypothetical protein